METLFFKNPINIVQDPENALEVDGLKLAKSMIWMYKLEYFFKQCCKCKLYVFLVEDQFTNT